MTKLSKPIKRETEALYIKRPLIIRIEPPNLIGIKEKGRRQFFYTTVERIYKIAVRDFVEGKKKKSGRTSSRDAG